MKRILLAAFTIALFTTTAQAGGPMPGGMGFGGSCLLCMSKLHQHGPLYNYGPYYGYPPFEPYGPWNQYLQYGASYGQSYQAAPTEYAPANDCPTCNRGSGGTPVTVIRPQLPQANGYTGYYNPYSPTPYYPQYAPQYTPQYTQPYAPQYTPVQYRNPSMGR